MNPFSCSRLRASQSCPFQARSFSCSVRDSSASTVSSMASCIQLSVLGHCTPPSIKGGMETSDFSNLGNKRGCKPACCFSSWIAAQNLESQRLSLPIARPVSAPPTSRAAESHSSGIGNRSLAISAIRVHPDPDVR